MDPVYATVRNALASEANFPLDLIEVEVWGGRFAALRPSSAADVPMFNIVLTTSRLRAEAHFVPDSFAGRLVRIMSDNLITDPSEWLAYLTDVESRTEVVLRVNEAEVRADALPDNAWQSVEIECVTGFATGSPSADARAAAVLDSATTCLALVMIALRTDSLEDDRIEDMEGASEEAISRRYERSRANRLRCLQHFGTTCWTCDFDFAEEYGELGAGFIEVHHVTPVAALAGPVRIDPLRDLVPLCSNCHSMIHRDRVLNPMSPPDLRKLRGRSERQWPEA